MLIKLPSSVINISQLSELVTQLDEGELSVGFAKNFFEVNPRINQTSQDIKMITEYLNRLLDRPVEMEVTFAQEADMDFITEITNWARENVHSNMMLNIKIDPLLTGGFVMRSPQRIYDFSWKNKLDTQRELLARLVTDAN